MSWPVVVELAGPPRGKGRHRSRITMSPATGAQYVQTYPDSGTVKYESQLRYAAQQAMAGAPPTDQPVSVAVAVTLAIPPSWSRKRQMAARLGTERPIARNSGDADNYLKILDALNGIVWRDDAQIVEATITKHYGEAPRLVVCIEPLVLGPVVLGPVVLPHGARHGTRAGTVPAKPDHFTREDLFDA